MITSVRTAIMMPGKVAEGRSLAQEFATVVTKVTRKPCRTGLNVGTNPSELCWIMQWDSLGQFEELTNKLATDPDYTRLQKAAEGVLMPGSIRDQLFRTN